jgi:phosphomethylpyrimidine synthase
MKITQDVRDYAATLNDPSGVGMSVSGVIEQKADSAEGATEPSEIEKGMAQMSAKFKEMGSNVYLDAEKVKESNRVL